MQRHEMVQAYLEVLDLQDRERNFEFLCDLVGRHVATFAFGSVGCRLGDELPLDFESLFDRLVVRRRGGYCFEQNGLLYEVLAELGFLPTLYLARVIQNQNIHPGLTHRISMVAYDGFRYVVDVGFGASGPRIPVLFSESETDDSGRIFRVAERDSGEFHMQVRQDGEFFSLYRFELSRYGPADCEVGHFYSHKHPDATFVNHLVASRTLADETRSLRNLDYWVSSASGVQTTKIGRPEQLRQVLVDELGVQVTEAESRRLFEGLDTKSQCHIGEESMQPSIDVQQQDQPSADDLAYVSRQFRVDNDRQSGVFPSKDLHLFAYAEDGQIVGGLFGNISWGWLHVDVLWVAESHRQHGIGTLLMDRAEGEAVAMDVQQAYLETTDFQALGFYEKRGYTVFAQLEDQPPGHVCYYMKKMALGEQAG